MKKIILLGMGLCMMVHLNVQSQAFPDGGFENCWDHFPNSTPGKADYWDFQESHFLSTLNTLHELTGDEGDAPLTAYRLEGAEAYDGNYAVKVVSNTMAFGDLNIFLPGVAATLFIQFEGELDCILGKPFSFTVPPSGLKGWYKYTPVNGDSAAIEIRLKRGGVVIGSGKQVVKETVADWSEFTVPVTYTSTEAPDSVIVIFASSGNYDFTNLGTLMQCKGQIGSALCIDNVEFEYLPIGINEASQQEIKSDVYPNPSEKQITVRMAKEVNGTVFVYDYLSRKTGEYPISGTETIIDIQDYAAGSYVINVVENGRIISSRHFVKQ
ncbi:MAG: T9SS type A sorting domain-containing protein [Bacteroidales bacterium]|jgi:hypothetical protein|nr:T9SS type A sorting domain-containing protein [Bacteroidales bacterium]